MPLLPLMYLQGKRIRKSVPKLPEATGRQGLVPGTGALPFQLITLGESTVAGVGVETHDEGFTGSLARELSNHLTQAVEWQVYAKSGFTARRVAEKLVPQIGETDADLIVIGLGGNDAFTLNPPWRWKRDIRDLIRAIRRRFPQTPIAFTNMPPIKTFPAFTSLIRFSVGNHVELLGRVLAELVEPMEGVSYYPRVITLEDWIDRLKVEAPPEAFFSDGVHPSKLTYQVWARDFAQYLYEKGIFHCNPAN